MHNAHGATRCARHNTNRGRASGECRRRRRPSPAAGKPNGSAARAIGRRPAGASNRADGRARTLAARQDTGASPCSTFCTNSSRQVPTNAACRTRSGPLRRAGRSCVRSFAPCDTSPNSSARTGNPRPDANRSISDSSADNHRNAKLHRAAKNAGGLIIPWIVARPDDVGDSVKALQLLVLQPSVNEQPPGLDEGLRCRLGIGPHDAGGNDQHTFLKRGVQAQDVGQKTETPEEEQRTRHAHDAASGSPALDLLRERSAVRRPDLPAIMQVPVLGIVSAKVRHARIARLYGERCDGDQGEMRDAPDDQEGAPPQTALDARPVETTVWPQKQSDGGFSEQPADHRRQRRAEYMVIERGEQQPRGSHQPPQDGGGQRRADRTQAEKRSQQRHVWASMARRRGRENHAGLDSRDSVALVIGPRDATPIRPTPGAGAASPR